MRDIFPADSQREQLIRRATEARSGAYAPYSGFPVGAAVMDADGRIYSGSNVENLSFGGTLCAERVSTATAVSSGVRRITAVAVISHDPEPCLPCGLCRQFLSEFCDADVPILACRADGTYVEYRFGDLFPYPFQSDQIQKGNNT